MSLNKDFTARLAIGISASLIFLCLAWYNDVALFLVIFFFAAFAMWEYYELALRNGGKSGKAAGYAAAAAFMLLAYRPPSGGIERLNAALALCAAALIALKFLENSRVFRVPAVSILAAALFGGFYIGGSMSCVLGLNFLDKNHLSAAAGDRHLLFLLPFVGAWASDTGAYLSGRIVGKEKLSRISPNKTVEGVVGAAFAGFVAIYIFGHVLNLPTPLIMFLGLTIPVVGLGGDLYESSIKRRFQAKDSGAFFRNHGGVLDRFDSIYFVAPLTYFAVYFYTRGF